ncbi:histone-lysine N-methyltransferase TRX1-like [Phalaenopsis equestris]|uniref:histone-lysine N-methyltransferase TRX1-like n=1 Tax=Phalaenopsis equestris TaxID=78828 RepID=UPI0009E639D0|nr:histone-lysine N-methyltransferase TRX1-like [Phalaenopsis equestris]
MPPMPEKFIHEEEEVDHPVRYLPIRHVYSSTTPCVSSSGSSNVVSKKVRARKIVVDEEEKDAGDEKQLTGLCHGGLRWGNADNPIFVYSRRIKKPRGMPEMEEPDIPAVPIVKTEVLSDVESENDKEKENREKEVNDGNPPGAEGDSVGDRSRIKNRRRVRFELLNLGAVLADQNGNASGEARRRGSRRLLRIKTHVERKISRCSLKDSSDSRIGKKWVELDFEGTDPYRFVGLACKVFWPLDDGWYKGSVVSYDSDSLRHHVKYNDGDEEHLVLVHEKIQFHVSSMEIQKLNLKKKERDHYEMLSLAVISDDCDVPEPGDVVWAKLTGHAVWPALIVNEPCAGASGLKREQSFYVQFFGTHNFARVSLKQVMPFGKGVHCSFDLKCKQGSFIQSLDEVKLYLSNQQLPERMLRFQKATGISHGKVVSEESEDRISAFEDLSGDELIQLADEYIFLPIEIGNLRVTSLGRVVRDSSYFHRKHHIWPEGYTAYRKFASLIDPSMVAVYKMEVLRNPKSISRPLFRVTTDDGEQIDGSNPTACWKEVYERIKCLRGYGALAEVEGCDLQKSGTYMFGFSVPLISKHIQCRLGLKNGETLPAGYRAVRIEWKDLDRCNVCHMDEEYEENLFLQCDKCRMMVHARCYGELGPMDGELWHCNLCRNRAPKSSPLCCLCPVIGGAMKPTTDGQWAHLACAIWIPETCLTDVKKMEPIDGVNRIHKDRWKLLCSICHVTYGACIQCSNSTCCVAYHPLCARAAGYCVELEDENKIHLMSLDDDDDQCVRLVSFCKKHSQPSSDRTHNDDGLTLLEKPESCYVPLSNLSGCARTEPYNISRRGGQKTPQIFAATSNKRLYVENRPYLVTGYCQNGIASAILSNKSMQTNCSSRNQRSISQPETSVKVSSMSEKYENMKSTFRIRLAFGKSRIHGFGVFAKLPHRAGDMVIEYSGELVRPSIADIREHCIYNSLVGAGTYMFRIDNERVIDATKAGSIAHLINHSCEPNCYSRVISVNGDEHIIIFAKRDISKWEELTYDYRFFSKDELACYCGFPRCRGIVNDIEERVVTIEVPRSDLIRWDDD